MTQPVIDCHSDVTVDVFRRRHAGERNVLARIHLPAYRAGGVVAAVFTVGGDTPLAQLQDDEQPYLNTIELLDALRDDVAESDGRFAIASSADEVKAYVEQGVFAIVPAIEGAMPVEGDLAKLQDLHARGVRIVGLTWNTRNEIAVGLQSGEGGLTQFGAEAIAAMNDLGILVDLSHATPETFWDVAEVSKAPLYASHSNAKALRDHARNLDDDQLRAIRDSGGVVGVCMYADFVSLPPADIAGVADQLDYLRDAVGADSVVVGADFLDYDLDATIAMAREAPNYNELPNYYPIGLETVASMQNLVTAMVDRGYTADEIDAIAGGQNFLHLLETTQTRGRAGD